MQVGNVTAYIDVENLYFIEKCKQILKDSERDVGRNEPGGWVYYYKDLSFAVQITDYIVHSFCIDLSVISTHKSNPMHIEYRFKFLIPDGASFSEVTQSLCSKISTRPNFQCNFDRFYIYANLGTPIRNYKIVILIDQLSKVVNIQNPCCIYIIGNPEDCSLNDWLGYHAYENSKIVQKNFIHEYGKFVEKRFKFTSWKFSFFKPLMSLFRSNNNNDLIEPYEPNPSDYGIKLSIA